MSAREIIDAREAEILKIVQSESDRTEVRQHVAELIEGEAFKGSPRSIRFLNYIVERAITGDFDSLKERVIGVELFGRSGSWNSGEDATVRVTASDVRKRLLQHYGRSGTRSKFRLGLPPGSYVLEIARVEEAHSPESPTNQEEFSLKDAIADPKVPEASYQPISHYGLDRVSKFRSALPWYVVVVLLIVIGLLSWDILAHTHSRNPQPRFMDDAAAFPWPSFFRAAPITEVITSDPNIAEIQGFTGGQLSVADYANHNYYVGPNKLTVGQERFCRLILRGDKAASFDVPIVSSVATLAALNARSILVRASRNIQISDLRTDNNFVFLGSPRSDPWFSFFNEGLDFQFVFDKQVQSEYISNVHPKKSELHSYLPTTVGWGTGQSYAVIALIRNPDQKGQVLLLAGATAEGTAAAGKVVTDPSQLTPMLKRCGIDPTGPLCHFELLLSLNTIAGSSSNINYAACHTLPGSDTSIQP